MLTTNVLYSRSDDIKMPEWLFAKGPKNIPYLQPPAASQPASQPASQQVCVYITRIRRAKNAADLALREKERGCIRFMWLSGLPWVIKEVTNYSKVYKV